MEPTAFEPDGGWEAIEHNGSWSFPRRLQPGDRIRVTRGPLMGLAGLGVKQSSHERVAILLSLLGAKRRVSMAAAEVVAMR